MPSLGFARINAAIITRRSYVVITDKLKSVGFKVGQEIDFIPFKGEITKGVYFLWIKGTKRYLVIKLKAASFARPLRIGYESFSWSQIEVIGEFAPQDAILNAGLIK